MTICAPVLIFFPGCEAFGNPPNGKGYVALLAMCGRVLIFSCDLKRRGPRQAKARYVLVFSPGFRLCPGVILSYALKRWRQPTRPRLCSPSAYLWPTAAFLPHFEALRTPHTGGAM